MKAIKFLLGVPPLLGLPAIAFLGAGIEYPCMGLALVLLGIQFVVDEYITVS